MKTFYFFLIFIGIFSLSSICESGDTNKSKPNGINKINHIVVIYLENHSFDNLYALFPGANTSLETKNYLPQVNEGVKDCNNFSSVIDTDEKPDEKPYVCDERFPKNLPNHPFLIDEYVPLDQEIPDLTHRFYQSQEQINGGRNDKFAAISNVGGLVMGYHDTRQTGLWHYARNYTLADNFFQAAFGGSFLNHFWLICACTPRYENAPKNIVAKLSSRGKLIQDGSVTPDGYAVNTLGPVYQAHVTGKKVEPTKMLPIQNITTIGDRLSEKNISWIWYAGGWNQAKDGKSEKSFVWHHHPFIYFKRFVEDEEARKKHLKDRTDLISDIRNNTLPSVTFYKPIGKDDQHPGYSNIIDGDADAVDIVHRIKESLAWNSTIIIVTYDENGGLWDHVAPPQGDRWGPGIRVPTIIISPYAKRGYIDHTQYDTTSILKLIETRFNLQPLGDRDAKANNLLNAFDF